MSDPNPSERPPRSFWIISAVALAWNLIGVLTYLTSVTLSPEALESMSDPERALYTDIPAWATSAYAIGVFGGTLGSLALLLRRSWAVPLLVLSLLGILVQMAHAFFMTNVLEVQGAGAVVLPLVIIVVAAFLVRYARTAKSRGWIR